MNTQKVVEINKIFDRKIFVQVINEAYKMIHFVRCNQHIINIDQYIQQLVILMQEEQGRIYFAVLKTPT